MTMNTPKLIAHLDLKGIHLRGSCFDDYLADLKGLGYDAVLVEYEDVFPFRSVSVAMDPDEVWSPQFLNSFLASAKQQGIEIIPLQQCFGHLEYVFRWPDTQQFCLPHGTRPRELNIDSQEAKTWFLRLLREVLEAHPESRFIHLGMDEAVTLTPYAKATGKNPMDLFLSYLDELCTLCEQFGKHPVIWSDMLEDHIAPDNIETLRSFCHRVTLAHWNYSSGDELQEIVRFAGWRCSRKLARHPETMKQALHDKVEWTEDWPESIAALATPYQEDSGHFAPFFQAAIWKKLGFSVWGSGGAGITQDRRLLPYYHWREHNIQGWKTVISRYQLDALLPTQWGRSNSCSVPNLFPDVCWPILQTASYLPDANFFPEIPLDVQRSLFFQIGKCRENWRIESRLIQEMEQLSTQVHTHAYEWNTLILMLRILHCSKSIEETLHLVVECYGGMGRMPVSGWTQDRETLLLLKQQLNDLQKEAHEHLSQRYRGRAVNEWFGFTFDRQFTLIDQGIAEVDRSMEAAKRLFQR